MADITYSNRITERRDTTFQVPGPGDKHNVKVLACGTIELAASASGTTLFLGRVPTTARLLPNGFIYNDDLATTGAPTLDIGLASVDSNITSDPDAINNGIALNSATTTTTVVADLTDVGKPMWEIAGASSDPGGSLDIYGTVADASTTQTGTVSVALFGYLD